MNKKLFAIAALALGLGSCTSDMENVVPGVDESQNTVHIVVGASRENVVDTRTILTENAGNLDCKWSENDKLVVTNESGIVKGILKIKNFTDDNHVFAYFEGTLVGVDNGNHVLNYYYLGTKNSDETELENLGTPYEHNYSVQTGTFENLTDYDIMSAQESSVVSQGQSYVENIHFTRRISAAHFVLNNLPEDFQGDVVVSGAGLRNKVKLDLNKHAVETTTVDPNTITIKNTGKDFRMIILPNGEDMKNGFEVTFTTTYNGVTYTGSRNFTKQLTEAKYYRKGNNDGTFSGLPVDMKPAKQYRVFYHINITDIDKSDPDGVRICTSLPDAVTDPTNYTVLNFTEPKIDNSKEIRNEANFTKGYLYEFLGWSTEASAAKSWATDNLGVEYAAKEDSEDATPTANDKIDLTTVATTETTENGQTYHDLHLYAKGSVMQYTLIAKSTDPGLSSDNDWMSAKSKNRLTGWAEIQMANYTVNPQKIGYEFIGWSRIDQNGKYIDEAQPIQKGDYVRINKNDPYGTWNPNFTDEDLLNRPIKGKQTLILYPVWKKIENGDINLDNYIPGVLK